MIHVHAPLSRKQSLNNLQQQTITRKESQPKLGKQILAAAKDQEKNVRKYIHDRVVLLIFCIASCNRFTSQKAAS